MLISLIPNAERKTIHCSQGDTALRKWDFQICAGSIIAPFGTASLVTPDTEISMTIDDDSYLCDCTEDLSAKAGMIPCKIKIEDDGDVIYSSLFYLHCEVRP